MEQLKLNLHLFGEGGAAGGGDGAAGGMTGGESAAAQAPAAEGAQRTAEEKAAAFEELINGEYADAFHARTQGIINQRFKESKNLEKRMADMQPLVDALSTRYGETDYGKLRAAIEADEGFYQEAADMAGMNVDQFKEHQELKRKAAAYDRYQQQNERAEAERRAFAQWEQQAQQLKGIYADFDFAGQCKDPATGPMFVKLLGQGVDMKTAYEVVNHDRLISGALQSAVSQAQQMTVQTIQAQGMRPQENGVGGSRATKAVKIDPAKMSKQEIADIARRAKSGERIDFTDR